MENQDKTDPAYFAKYETEQVLTMLEDMVKDLVPKARAVMLTQKGWTSIIISEAEGNIYEYELKPLEGKWEAKENGMKTVLNKDQLSLLDGIYLILSTPGARRVYTLKK